MAIDLNIRRSLARLVLKNIMRLLNDNNRKALRSCIENDFFCYHLSLLHSTLFQNFHILIFN